MIKWVIGVMQYLLSFYMPVFKDLFLWKILFKVTMLKILPMFSYSNSFFLIIGYDFHIHKNCSVYFNICEGMSPVDLNIFL